MSNLRRTSELTLRNSAKCTRNFGRSVTPVRNNWEWQKAMNNGKENEMYANYDLIENVIVPFVSKYGQNSFNSQYYQTYYTGRRLVKNASGEWEMNADFSTLGREIEMYYRACPDLHYVQGPTHDP